MNYAILNEEVYKLIPIGKGKKIPQSGREWMWQEKRNGRVYGYLCTDDDFKFKSNLKINKAKCPSCGGENLMKTKDIPTEV